MGLSIERRLVGDIIVAEKEFYVLVKEVFAQMICDEVHRVRHTEVRISICEDFDVEILRKYEHKYGTIASERLDCIISEFTNSSRSQALKLIKEGLVYVNSRQIYHNSFSVKQGDVISIRHVGKYKVIDLGGLSRKGKIKIEYDKYI